MKKVALVTGASSGIGKEMAIDLNRRGYNIILVARREERLVELQKKLKGDNKIIVADLSKKHDCFKLYEQTKDMNVSVLINNAGFGLVGEFVDTNLDRELEMINVNCSAVHILTKLFLRDFTKKNYGYILNVASSAGLMAGGPMMSTYYASKAYVVSLTSGINQELKCGKSNVVVSALCPGPVDTEFNDVANCSFAVSSITPKDCARIGLRGLFDNKMIIIPEPKLKAASIFSKFIPRRALLSITGKIQKKKINS